jgi:hypothetical protein
MISGVWVAECSLAVPPSPSVVINNVKFLDIVAGKSKYMNLLPRLLFKIHGSSYVCHRILKGVKFFI